MAFPVTNGSSGEMKRVHGAVVKFALSNSLPIFCSCPNFFLLYFFFGKTIKCLHLQFKYTSKTILQRRSRWDGKNDRHYIWELGKRVPSEGRWRGLKLSWNLAKVKALSSQSGRDGMWTQTTSELGSVLHGGQRIYISVNPLHAGSRPYIGHWSPVTFNLLLWRTITPASEVCYKNLGNDLILHENFEGYEYHPHDSY